MVRVVRLMTTLALIGVVVLPPPGIVLANTTGSHYAGAQSTARYAGVYGWLEITNPGARANTIDFVANRVMAKNATGSEWIEVGWAEVGWELVGGYPEQWVYVYDTVHDQWHFYGGLVVGSHVDVRILSSSSCDPGDPTCVWTAQLFNHGSGLWENLHSVTLPMDYVYLEEYTEVYVDPGQPLVHIAIDNDSNHLDWFETQRRFAAGDWRLWGNSNTFADDSSTVYCTSWTTLYSKFWTYKGSC